MNREELKQKIEERLPGVYPEKGMEIVLVKIEKMDTKVRENLEIYLSTGDVQEMEVEGFSVNSLIEERNMNPLAAYLTLDWLARDPEAAQASLSKGSDIVTKSQE